MDSKRDIVLSALNELRDERETLLEAKRLLVAEIVFHKNQLQEAEIELATNKTRQDAMLKPKAPEKLGKTSELSPKSPKDTLKAMMARIRESRRSPLKLKSSRPAVKRRKTDATAHRSARNTEIFGDDTDDEEDLAKVIKQRSL